MIILNQGLYSDTGKECTFFIYFYLLMLYKAGRIALKVCGLPVPTARKYTYMYSRLYSDLHIGDQMIVSVSCSD